MTGRARRLVRSSWHMYPLGILFGLGLETASEITLFATVAAAFISTVYLAEMLVHYVGIGFLAPTPICPNGSSCLLRDRRVLPTGLGRRLAGLAGRELRPAVSAQRRRAP